MLCGTPEEVAEGAVRYNQAGMDTPIIQPVVQEDVQIQLALKAASLYGSLAVREVHPVRETAIHLRGEREHLNVVERQWRRFSAAVEIIRPFSFTASAMPVLAAAALTLTQGKFNFTLFIISLAASVLLHVGANVTNEIFDVRNGVDAITSPNASQALLKGRMTEKDAFRLVGGSFVLAILFGIALIALRGWPVALLGLTGLILGYSYTAPPFQYKYRALGLPLIFTLMGPLMVLGAYYVITGEIGWSPFVVSLPIGLLVTAILHGNEWRDITDDARFGVGTVSTLLGRKWAHFVYLALVTGAYLILGLGVLAGALPHASLLALLSLPFLVRSIRTSELGINGQQRAIAKIDLETAQLHAAFGILFVLGLAI